jgi:antitoxin ParD1/3/4
MNAKTRAYVENKVRSGEYESEEAVYDAAIEALQREDEAFEALRREIDIGLADADAGRFSDLNAIEIGEAAKRQLQGR